MEKSQRPDFTDESNYVLGPIGDLTRFNNYVATPTGPEISVAPKNSLNEYQHAIADETTQTDPAEGTYFRQTVPICEDLPREFRIKNYGGSDLNLSQATLAGGDAGEFVISSYSTTLVPPGGTFDITITFRPLTSGLKTATVNIPSNDADEGTFNFVVQGLGADGTETIPALSFVGYNFNQGADKFSFVAMRDITNGEVFYFADETYDPASNQFESNSETLLKYTSPGITQGQVIVVSEGSANTATVSCGGGATCANGNVSFIGTGQWSFGEDDVLYAFTTASSNTTRANVLANPSEIHAAFVNYNSTEFAGLGGMYKEALLTFFNGEGQFKPGSRNGVVTRTHLRLPGTTYYDANAQANSTVHFTNNFPFPLESTPPVAACPASLPTVMLDASGNGTLPAFTNNGPTFTSTDNCDVATEGYPQTSVTCAKLGTQNVTFTATDVSGNQHSTTCSFSVVDQILPTPVCPVIPDVILNNSNQGSLPALNRTSGFSSSDNCTVASESYPAVSGLGCSDVGVTQSVTLTVIDGSGNTNTATCNFEVTEMTPPAAACPGSITDVSLDASGNGTLSANIGGGNSTDNCGPPTETSPSQAYTCSDLGTQTVVLTATDAAGNTNTATCSFQVVDRVPPAANCPNSIADVMLDGNGNGTLLANIGGNNSTDNCSVMSETSPSQSYTCADLGTQTVVLTATDGSGNTNTATCSFQVVDNIPPVANCPNSIAEVQLDASGNGTLPADIGGGNSTDNCGPPIETSPSQSYTCSDIGTQTVVLTATDGSGNSNTATCAFQVADRLPPIPVCPTISTVVLGSNNTATLPAYSITSNFLSSDNCSMQSESYPSQSLDCSNLGSNFVVLDGYGWVR